MTERLPDRSDRGSAPGGDLPTVIAAVDIGTNSTRLLVCSIERTMDGLSITDLERHSNVTRLGHGVDVNGRLDPAAKGRVLEMLDSYREIAGMYPVDLRGGVLTSAGRDAADGAAFRDEVEALSGFPVRLIGGDEEARLSYSGATSERHGDERTLLVCDVGGGSTELVVGRGGQVRFHTSLDAGVVRQSERHLRDDPPAPGQLAAIAAEVGGLIAAAVPPATIGEVEGCIAVAGTATTLSAIDQELEPYDPTKVHGATVSLERSREILGRIASLPLAERREVAGLHPDRAPTAVAGAVILTTILEAFGLDRFEASEHDILRGEALRLLDPTDGNR